MTRKYRIGCSIALTDAFWVQVREAIYQGERHYPIEIVELDADFLPLLECGRPATLEEALSQQLDALITMYFAEEDNLTLLNSGLPVIHLMETPLRHPLLVSSTGFYGIAQIAAEFLVGQIGGRGHVLMAGGGFHGEGEDGLTRLAGFRSILEHYPAISIQHIPTSWEYASAYEEATKRLIREKPIDGILGLSDSLALAAHDAAQSLIDSQTCVVGINGDPVAYAAIFDGKMAATVDTNASGIGLTAVRLAYEAARGKIAAPTFSFDSQLVTRASLSEAALPKLISIAEIPNRLIRLNLQKEKQRLNQLETSLEINQRVGSLLDRQQLSRAIAHSIRDNYGYDEVRLFLLEDNSTLIEEQAVGSGQGGARLSLAQAGLLSEALDRDQPIYLVNAANHTGGGAPEGSLRSRVVIPIHLGTKILGLLDLRSQRVVHRTRHELNDLQSLANQFGVALHNAELYGEAVATRQQAEKADQLKTRLLANVSHELRVLLQVILGYTQGALALPELYSADIPDGIQQSLEHIQHSGEHLNRLVNDLLDLSRAEIGKLDLCCEMIAPTVFLTEVFNAVAREQPGGHVGWKLDVPSHLPMIQADPVRLRQILLNLLSNARKFTSEGQITLGASLLLPHLHIWVKDTGEGIPVELQEAVFEPFMTVAKPGQQKNGTGLGLYIARQLVALHGGSITLESQPDQGSTFHVYLPLPNLAGQPQTGRPQIASTRSPAVLLIGTETSLASDTFSQALRHRVDARTDLDSLLREIQPVALSWDLAQADPRDWEIVQKLRHYPALCQLPFILYSQDQTTNFVVKPLTTNRLVEMLKALPSEDTGTILIVDDDLSACEFYESLIHQVFPAHPVETAHDGRAALRWLENARPSLVLLDLVMPEVDGFQVLEGIRSQPQTRAVPVLVLSGQILSFEDVERLDHARVTYQSKEVLHPAEFARLVNQLIEDETSVPQYTSLLVKRAVAYIHCNYAQILSREIIAAEIGVTEGYLSRIVHQELGISLWEYLTRFRIRRAKQMLLECNEPVAIIAAKVGFDDPQYFSRVFRKHLGLSPSAFRNQAQEQKTWG